MNAEERVEKSGSPVSTRVETVSVTTTAPLPLS
jgi:hypothetical protein